MKHKKAVKKKNKAGSVKFKSHSYAKHVKLRTKSAAKAQKNTTQKSAAQKNAVTSSAASSLAFDANIKPSQPSSPVRFNIPGRQLNKPHKLRIGIFSFTSCAGCQFEILDLEDELLEIVSKTEVLHFPMAKADNEEGPFDVVFVEGAVTTKDEAKKIKEIREKTAYLVALGTCASFGGVPSIKDFYTEEQIEVPVYQSTKAVQSIRADGIANYVKVDYFMRGCPPNKYEFLHVMKELILGKVPAQPDFPVCKECRENKNICMLQLGKPCMGPITYGGCDSVCVNNGIACKGCRGPIDDANVDMIVGLYERMGFIHEDVKRFFVSYAGTSKIFSKFVGQTCQVNDEVLQKLDENISAKPTSEKSNASVSSSKKSSKPKLKIKVKTKTKTQNKTKVKSKVTKHAQPKKRR